MGIEPTSTAWEAVVLPMNYIRWSEWRDLNPRPLGPEPSTLPTALHPVAANTNYMGKSSPCQDFSADKFRFCLAKADGM